MKKIFRYKFLLAAVLMGTFASCTDDDDITLDTRSDKPLVSLDQTSASVTEGESVTFTMTSDRPLSEPMNFKVELVGGEGSFREFTVDGGGETTISDGAGIIGYLVTMPAYATTHTFTITPDVDLDVEGTETFEIAFTSAGNGRGLVADGSDMITLTVADYVSNDVGLRLTWAQVYADAFGTLYDGEYTAATGVNPGHYSDFDFDIYVIDTATFDEVSGYAGATGASPEMVTLSEDLPDGEYWLIVDLYSAGPAPAQVFEHDISLQVSKFGNWSVTIPLTYLSNHATSAPNGLNGGEVIAAVLTKTGTTYVLSTEEGEVLAQGRMAQIAGKLKNNNVRL